MLTVKNASFTYGSSNTGGFKNIDFSLQKGEVLSILGPNGCGKTTLLKCLSGIFKLNTGTVWLEQHELGHMKRNEIARLMGYVPQTHLPSFPFSVLQVVLIGRAPHLTFLQSPKQKDIEIAEATLSALEISHLEHKAYTHLSGGERQMVVFARVMTQQPSLLLLDEPTSHLDFGNQIRILQLVEELSSSGLPVIMTTHFPDHAFLVSDKVAIMKQGEFLDFGAADEVITDSNLKKAYGINVKVMNLDSGINQKICVPLKSELHFNSNINKLLEQLYGSKL
jgi:iron complex transport system ATP-binding protein